MPLNDDFCSDSVMTQSDSDSDAHIMFVLRGATPGESPTDADVPLIDMASSDALPEIPDAAILPPAAPKRPLPESRVTPVSETGLFWLAGDVLMCACPECQAPMTVRIWLMIADCWRCDASVELTLEQEREARRLLERHRAPAEPPAPSPVATSGAATATAPRTRQSDSPSPSREPVAPPREPTRAVRQPTSAPRRTRRRGLGDWLNAFLKNMPAWLISLIFHMILLTILGLLTSKEDEGLYITLSARVSRVVREGGDTRIIDPTDNSVFDMGLPDELDLDDPIQRRMAVQAEKDARANCDSSTRTTPICRI